ncbi:tetratricopeptide (TPR) repeat protein [Crossiella equi]|uniref:Tetratricopeptide (TPR) repeat protein n=1 Tax=Crossiella equi TaxID=130796 RepID=A0ABS5AS50_9PSEU|nr:sialidase family protein [Crossiella equi]MBP2479042.1 tetratricopeptide (TPR) repeat protein [Crossiella equi]
MNLTGFACRLVTPAVVVAVLASGLAAPPAVAAEPGPTPDQLSTALFGAAVQLKDNGRTHERNLLLSAELVDWRAKNPAASADALDRHAADVDKVVGQAVAPANERDLAPDVLGRGVEALYAIPEVDRGGAQLKVLTSALATRDLRASTAPEDLRGVLTQITASSIEVAPRIWATLREAAGRDATLNTTWKNRLGKATVAESAPVDPAAPLAALKQLPQVKKVIDVDAIQAGFTQGFDQGMAALTKQIKPLIKVLGDPSSPNTPLGKAMAWVKEHVDPVTGEIKKPDEDALKRFAEDAKQFEDYLDKVKGGLTAFASVVKVLSPRYAQDLVKFADTLYKIGKHVMPMINAVAALGTAIAAGAAIGSIVPAIGTVIGAAVGLVTTLVGLLGSGGGGPSPELRAIQAMHTEMRESFKDLKQFLIDFRTEVNARFDRIDATLNLMFGEMLLKFDQVLAAIAQSNWQLTQQIRDLHGSLLTIATNVQANLQQVMAALQADGAKDFRAAVRKYLDYAAREGQPIPSYDQGGTNYLEGARAFADGGDDLARTALFMHNGQDAAPEAVLPGNNSAYLVNYLKTWAVNNVGQEYGNGHPATGVPNADLLAAAMRAYGTLMNQNPELAAKEPLVEIDGKKTVARVDDLLKAGNDVLAAARRFNQPRFKPATGPWVATNTLLERLQKDNATRLTQLANSLAAYEHVTPVKEPDRPFALWEGRDQRVEGFMKWDNVTVPRCTHPTAESTVNTMPDLIKSDQLPNPVRLLKQLFPGMELRTCSSGSIRTNDHWYNRTTIPPERIPCKWGQTEPGCVKSTTVRSHKMTNVTIEFQVWGTIPGHTSESLLALRLGTGEVEVCNFPGATPADDEPRTVNCDMTRPDLLLPKLGTVPGWRPTSGMREWDTVNTHPVLDKALADRRAKYYALVAGELRDPNKLPASVQADTTMRLLRAFLEIGFPTALQSDGRFRELLYGTKAIPSSLNVRQSVAGEVSPLAALYFQAAKNLSERKDPLHEQAVFSKSELPNCASAPAEVTTLDPVARCLVTISGLRRAALGERIEYYSTDLVGHPAAQDPQTVTALMRSLRVQTKATHPGYPLTPPGETGPVPPAEIGKTFGGLGGSSRATLGGRHFMVWQGRQDEVLVAASEDGRQWWPPVTVSRPHTASDTPALAVLGDRLVAVWTSGPFTWTDGNNDRTLATSTSTDGRTWTTPVRLADAGLGSEGVGLSVQHGKLVLVYRGKDQGKYVTSSHDGRHWKRPLPVVDNGATAAAPALTTLNGTLVQLWRGWEGDEALYHAVSSNGVDWSRQNLLGATTARSPSAPSLTTHGGTVFAVWRNAADDGLSVADTADGGAWSAPRPLHADAHAAVGAPSLGVVGGKLAAIWRDAGNADKVLVSTSADGRTWSAPEPIAKLTPEARAQRADAMITEATRLWQGNQREQAISKAQEALVLARDLAREVPNRAATLARYLRNPVSGYLAESGRHDEAIALLDEAVAAYRRLGTLDPGNPEHRLNEADTLVAQGTRIWAKGDRDKGRDRALEGVNLARTLVSKGPGFASAFAQWIRTPVAGYLFDTGKREESIALLGEAVSTYRALARQEPHKPEHKFNEADTLVQQGSRLWTKGDKPAGLAKVMEGIGVARPLAATAPGYAAGFAQWIRTPASGYLAESGRHDEAIALLGEAVTTYRQLSQQDPQRSEYKLNEADALVWQGFRMWHKGERDKGRDRTLEGIALARTLVSKGSGYASAFAQWIRFPAAGFLADTGKHDESVALLGEAVATYRQLVQQHPDNAEYKLYEADALVQQGTRLWAKGDKPAALAKVQEGLAEARKVAPKGPSYSDHLATWLLAPAADYALGNGRKPEAVALAREAVEVYTRLTAADAKYQPKLDAAKQKLAALQA